MPQKKLSEDQVRQILERRGTGETVTDLAEDFHVSAWTIQGILEGLAHRHIPAPIDRATLLARVPERKNYAPHRRLTPDIVREARKLYAEGWTLQELSDKFDKTTAALRGAIRGCTFSEIQDPPPIEYKQQPKKISPELLEELREARAKGQSWAYLGHKYGIPWNTIRREVLRGHWPDPQLDQDH